MQLPVIGTIYSSAKVVQLNIKWKERKDDLAAKKKKSLEDPEITRLKEDAANICKSNATSTIDGKLKAGASLTNEELEYLRANNPDLYQKALEIIKERVQYKKQLENCKTQEDVDELKTYKLQGFVTEVQTIKSNPNIPMGKKKELLDQITRRLMGIYTEHTKFIKSNEFLDLPKEDELDADKNKPQKQNESVKERNETWADSKEFSDILQEYMPVPNVEYTIGTTDTSNTASSLDIKDYNTKSTVNTMAADNNIPANDFGFSARI